MNQKNLSAKEYLQQIQLLDININQNLERLAEMKTDALFVGCTNYDRERVQSTMTGNKTCNDITRYLTLEESINKEIDHFVNLKNQIISEIRSLRISKYVEILYKVYVQNKSLKTSSVEMNLSYSYVLELYHQALTAFENIYTDLKYL